MAVDDPQARESREGAGPSTGVDRADRRGTDRPAEGQDGHGVENPARRFGSQLLDDVFNWFGSRIKRFKAEWVKGPRFGENYNEFMTNLRSGTMSLKDCAWETWTGRQMRARGFTDVIVPEGVTTSSTSVYPVFVR
jgi:hypothetical protein